MGKDCKVVIGENEGAGRYGSGRERDLQEYSICGTFLMSEISIHCGFGFTSMSPRLTSTRVWIYIPPFWHFANYSRQELIWMWIVSHLNEKKRKKEGGMLLREVNGT